MTTSVKSAIYHTLSGGESFIAALSLALALGESIQNESGGIGIDALFIDEGLVSLDGIIIKCRLWRMWKAVIA